MSSTKPYQISLTAWHPTRPHLRANYRYTVAARDASTNEQAAIEACWRAAKEGLLEPLVYAIARGY